MKSSKTRPATTDGYLAAFPDDVRRVLERVRAAIGKALPEAEEVISYGIPAFRQNGRTVIYFAGWKEHFSIYPANDRMHAAFEKELEPYERSGKGTIRFPLSKPPLRLIAALAKFRLSESAGTSSKRPNRKAGVRRRRPARATA
jgi:uncharacterized protein YdhG (YjbR/CyaY superfamily)